MLQGSGKQIFLKMIQQLSTSETGDDDLDMASERLRAVLLIYASTSADWMSRVERVSWSSKFDEERQLRSQGICLQSDGEKAHLAEVCRATIGNPGFAEFAQKVAPQFSEQQMEDFVAIVLHVVVALEMNTALLGVENGADPDLDAWVEVALRKLSLFREDPSQWE